MSHFLSQLRFFGGAFLLTALMGCGQSELAPLAEGNVSPNTQGRLAVTNQLSASPYPARVVITSLDGPPASQSAKVMQRIETAAQAHQVQLIKGPQADYFVRLYMADYPSQSGSSLTYVWDVFDSQKQFSRRLEDQIPLSGAQSSNVWSQMDDKTLALLAERSALDLAGFLAQTPQALAGQNQTQTGRSPALASLAGAQLVATPSFGFIVPP